MRDFLCRRENQGSERRYDLPKTISKQAAEQNSDYRAAGSKISKEVTNGDPHKGGASGSPTVE